MAPFRSPSIAALCCALARSFSACAAVGCAWTPGRPVATSAATMMTSNRLMVSTPCGADYRHIVRRPSRRSSGLGQTSRFEAVADAADVLQVAGLVDVGFELLPQTADVVVDDAVGHE